MVCYPSEGRLQRNDSPPPPAVRVTPHTSPPPAELGANLLGDQESEGEPDEADSAAAAAGTPHRPPLEAVVAEPAVGPPGGAAGQAQAEEGSTSGVSTINSVRHDDYTPQTLADLHRLRNENKR